MFWLCAQLDWQGLRETQWKHPPRDSMSLSFDISEVIWRTVMLLPKMENELVKRFER